MKILQDAIAAYQNGQNDEARRMVLQAIQEQPKNEAAWGLLIYVAKDEAERDQAVERVLAIDPNNETALRFKAQESAMSGQAMTTAGFASPLETAGQPASGASGQAGASGSAKSTSNVYQMLWDCEFCGSTKLLGLTHRFCPNCGSPQNPDKRYFPSDEEKIAVEDHKYHGADRICPSCNTANSAAAEFCMQCGTPLSDAARASVRESQTRGGDGFKQGEARDLTKEKFDATVNSLAGSPAKSRRRVGRWGWAAIVATVLSLTGGGVYGLFFWEREALVVVAGHEWERTIEIERFQEVDEGDWCDSMPGDAYDVSRSERQRSTRRVEDGETCTTRRVDQGDGTFREEEVCSPTYREEPVYDTYCDYTVNRWRVFETEEAQGGLEVDPFWPAVSISQPGDCLGCEREGDHAETYTVIFREDGNNETYRCEFNMERWRSFTVESRWILQVAQATGSPDCDSLEPAP